MRARKLLPWGGLIFCVLSCALPLVGGALAIFLLDTGGREDLSLALTLRPVSFAGTFALSVMFFIFMLRTGHLGS